MTSVDTVIAAIDARRPGMSARKAQMLLFFCQGHHLADLGTALFAEPLHAARDGVLVETNPDEPEPAPVDNGQLNTVGYVLTRYANLSPADLRTLIQASAPWQMGRKVGEDNRIEWAWLRDWFLRADEQNDPDDDRPTAGQMAAYVAKYGKPRRPEGPAAADNVDDFRALAAQLRGASG